MQELYLQRKQFLDVLVAHDFTSHVSRDNAMPHIVGINSSEYCEWVKIEKLILSWITTTIHSSIHSYILSSETARERWVMLDQLRMMKTTPDLSMEEYLRCIRALADSLVTSGKPLKEHEIIDYVTGGLGVDYNNLVTNLFFQEPKT